MHLRGADGVPILYEPHVVFKKRVPQAIGLIRTATRRSTQT